MKNNIFSSLLLMMFILIIMPGCASTDRVVFVTSTEIGIGADAKIGNVNIGYDRNELVIGPAYPETGAAPPVFARIETNLKVFNPQIKQLYATGEAANIVTGNPVTGQAKGLTGKRRAMFFGTSTNLGLKVHFTGQAPDSFNFGYKRRVLSVIPLQKDDPSISNKPDMYASVIAGLEMTANATSFADTGIKLSQFIATGTAAENLAKNEDIQEIFTAEARAGLGQKETNYEEGVPERRTELLKLIDDDSYKQVFKIWLRGEKNYSDPMTDWIWSANKTELDEAIQHINQSQGGTS